jgi:hypothetical protein
MGQSPGAIEWSCVARDAVDVASVWDAVTDAVRAGTPRTTSKKIAASGSRMAQVVLVEEGYAYRENGGTR